MTSPPSSPGLDLLSLCPRVEQFLAFDWDQLRTATERPSVVDLDELLDHPNEHLADMAEAALQWNRTFWAQLQLIFERWQVEPSAADDMLRNGEMALVLNEMAVLPNRACQDSLALTRYLSSRSDAAGAYRYAALLLLFAVRVICFGERRGLDQVAGSVERKGWRFARLLGEDSGLVVSGFLVLYRFTHTREDATALVKWAQGVMGATQNLSNPVSLAVAVYFLLTSVGKGALASDPEFLKRHAE